MYSEGSSRCNIICQLGRPVFLCETGFVSRRASGVKFSSKTPVVMMGTVQPGLRMENLCLNGCRRGPTDVKPVMMMLV